MIFVCEDCRARRKGKFLRPVIHIGSAAEVEFGSGGRIRPIQLTPFEVQSSYGGTVAGRHNLDVQDMRRVLDPALWLGARDCLPQIGGLAPQLGYMSRFEWNGTAYDGRSTSSPVPVSWISRRQLAAGFREDWLRAHEGEKMEDPLAAAKQISSASSESSSEDEDLDFDKAIRCGVSEAFADGINSGFYVNSCSAHDADSFQGMFCSSLPYVMSVCVFWIRIPDEAKSGIGRHDGRASTRLDKS